MSRTPDGGDATTVRDTAHGRLYLLAGRSQDATQELYRYLAIVTGSEPGQNGHRGLDDDDAAVAAAQLPLVVDRVSRDHGGHGVVPGNGSVTWFEAYVAKALCSALYRPFFAEEAGIDDAYGHNWGENLDALVRSAGGIPADALAMILARAADGRPIAAGQDGAAELFPGPGARFQPARLRRGADFSRAPGRLREVIASRHD